MRFRFALYSALLLSFSFAGYAQEKSGMLHGTIVARNAEKNELVVKHGAVQGIMGAMTMTYQVRGQTVTALPRDGTEIMATLHDSDGTLWLTDVKPAMQPMQHEMGGHAMPGMQMPMQHDATHELLMRQTSGTSMNPAAAPHAMMMTQYGNTMLMAHGQAFVAQVIQSGPRGDDKLYSTNWIMGMADRPLAGGHLMLRTMLSLEPATIGKKYPELFQTGETVDNRPIVDAQHPHDFFMELAAEYARPLDAQTIAYLYAAPMGDPALGPVAYPHRASASEIPQATLSHHLQDSTHIAGSVLTAGVQRGEFGLGLSGFHGREPDEKRWDLDTGAIDSWAARFTWDPTPNWSAQVSTGHLKHPEALEPGNIQRTTASVSYSSGPWNSSLILGHNDKSAGRSTSGVVAESVYRFLDRNDLTGRLEIVDKDELFPGQDAVFRIHALTLGYTRDILAWNGVLAAAGGNVTGYSIPADLRPVYGRGLRSFYVFLRLRNQ